MNKSFNASLQLLYLFASSIAFATEVVVDGSLNDSGWQSAKRNTVNYQVVPQTLTKVELKNLNQANSHNQFNVSHTVLGALSLESSIYDSTLDVLHNSGEH